MNGLAHRIAHRPGRPWLQQFHDAVLLALVKNSRSGKYALTSSDTYLGVDFDIRLHRKPLAHWSVG